MDQAIWLQRRYLTMSEPSQKALQGEHDVSSKADDDTWHISTSKIVDFLILHSSSAKLVHCTCKKRGLAHRHSNPPVASEFVEAGRAG